MNNILEKLFAIEKKPKKGLMAFEWVVLAYLLSTLVFIIVFYSKLPNVHSMIGGRVRVAAITFAMWGVYRLLPCGLTRLMRAVVQLALLSWWYPDIFELNRIFPNLDHLFASWEQTVFGCQPALLFSQLMGHPIISELMCMGYACYYPMMVVVALAVIIWRYEAFERVAFVIIGTFFIHYVIFIALPVTGPQYYFEAVGVDEIAKGVFPNLHDYFNHHQECMPCPGYENGMFYGMVDSAHKAGERPVAAFPSSHVGVCLMLLLVTLHYRLRRLFWCLVPFAVLLFLSTVYIRAHYAIDALAGLLSGTLCYLVLMGVSKGMEGKPSKRNKFKRRK